MFLVSGLCSSLREVFQLINHALLANVKLLHVIIASFGMFILISIFVILICLILIKLLLQLVPSGESGKQNVAFFHPYCNAGGGGERVLWTAIQAIQSRYPQCDCYVYTGDTDATPSEIMENVYRRFNIELKKNPQFIYLNFRIVVEAKYYPFFTLLMQSLGSCFLGAEAMFKFRPNVFIDTMGYAFTYPLFRFLCGCTVASYTHYPTISSDMLGRISERREAHNNQGFISQSYILSCMKLLYYYLFAFLYGLVGSCAHIVMVNSTWTKNHISLLFKLSPKVEMVYPPCDTERFSSLALIDDEEKDIKSIVSIGQFRPEKDYPLMLKAFRKLTQILKPMESAKLRLVLIGGVRNTEDEKRVQHLQSLASELGIDGQVVWKINAPFPELLLAVQRGTVGIHTMWNEHFGIGVVELMAGGLIVVAHDSGGPKMDIVKPLDGKITGFLASTEDEYALTIKSILMLPDDEKLIIREDARESAKRFNADTFQSCFISAIQPFLEPHSRD